MKPFDLAVGEWWKSTVQTGSKISDVYASPAPSGTQASIINAWGSMAYDSKRKELVICNGGHADYSGNEGYAFSLMESSSNFLKWRVKWYYSARSDGTAVNEYADGTPSAAHSYNGFLYNPTRDTFVRMPGVFVWGSAGENTVRTYELDAAVDSPASAIPSYWTRKSDTDKETPAIEPKAMAIYNPNDGLIYAYEGRGLVSFDASLATGSQYVAKTNFEGGPLQPFNMGAAMATQGPGYFVNVGNGSGMQVRRMDTWAFVTAEADFATSGAVNIETSDSPGIIWDENSQLIIGWHGLLTGGTDRRDYYTLDLQSKVWTRIAGTGDTPTAPNSNGTFRRFLSIGDGLVALVNATNEEVYFLRVSQPLGTPVPPTFQQLGTSATGTGAVTPAWPPHQTGDIGLLIVESCGGEAVTLTTPAGFVAVTNSPQATGVTTAGTQVSVYWCRATSNAMSTPTVGDPGDHVYALILTFRGCAGTGNPWDVTAGSVKAGASTTTTFDAVTTTKDNCLIVNIATRDTDSAAAAWSAWANASLTLLVERQDAGTTSGNGGGIGVATGVLATHGSSGATTATVSSSINAEITIALRPPDIKLPEWMPNVFPMRNRPEVISISR